MALQFWLLEWITLFALWHLLVDKLTWSEAFVGAAAAALGATGAEIVRGQHLARFWPHAHWLFEFWRVPGYILDGYAVLAKALIKKLAGKRSTSLFQAVRFPAGGPDARSSARRALVITFTTLPPNFVIVGIDQQKNLMLVHQVEPSDVPEIVRKLEEK